MVEIEWEIKSKTWDKTRNNMKQLQQIAEKIGQNCSCSTSLHPPLSRSTVSCHTKSFTGPQTSNRNWKTLPKGSKDSKIGGGDCYQLISDAIVLQLRDKHSKTISTI
jgi:hypothetical protein